MEPRESRVESVFFAALEKALPEERASYLTDACAGDEVLRQRVERLLNAQPKVGNFLQADEPAFAPTMAQAAPVISPGTQIGPYKLLQLIGEGGMGMVYMAEQATPVRRKVALKIIKPGMDTREVIARFEAERQALALMDHSNIAYVFDGGVTEAGRPYFVMELVRGIPITDYCDQNNLPVHERLELIVTVCHAVQHAHQKGIIHRDIKPSNVLVTLHDGRPVPKVIDFGVAKAVGQQLTEKTLFTQFAQMVGTPLYMSPEQAELAGRDVDTRGDIYSLGVLLYELLTGTTPFEQGRVKKAALEEIRRMIREEDPPSPSTRLSSTVGESQTAVAAHRRIDPKSLSRLVRGDLDWIVMKALEKDRNRRYETANSFAADIGRYLSDEPVQASPPSAVYRFRKFVRRNRGTVLAGTFVLVTLLVGIAGTTIGLVQARAERDRVIAAKEQERLALLVAEENFQTARDAVDKMYTRAAEEMRDKPQVEHIRRALLEDAARFYQGFLEKKSKDPAVRYEAALSHRRVGEIYGYLGEGKSSLEYYRQAVAMLADLSSNFANDANYRDELARTQFYYGQALLSMTQIDAGAASIQRAIALLEPLIAEFPDRPSYLEDLARANLVLGRGWNFNYQYKGEQYVRRGQELLGSLKQKFPGHQISNGFQTDLNALLEWRYTSLPHETTALKQLERECRDQLSAAEIETRRHPDATQFQVELAKWLGSLGNVLTALNDAAEVEELCRRKLQIHQRLARQHPDVPAHRKDVAWTEYALGEVLYDTDRPDEALDHFQTAIKGMSRLAEEYPEYVRYYSQLGGMLHECPLPRLRDPSRALDIALRVKQLKDVGWENVVVCQIDAGQYTQALETCEKASQAGERSAHYPYATAVAYWHLGRKQDARELLQQTVLRLQTEPSEYWWGSDFRRRTREAAKLMGLEFEGLRSSDPETVLRNGIALYQKLAAERPDDTSPIQELAKRYDELWQLLANARRDEEADRVFNESGAVWRKRVAEFPTVPDHRHQLVGLLIRRGNSLHWTRTSLAEQPYRDALTEAERLVTEFPDVLSYRLQLADCRRFVGWILLDTGRPQEGEPFARLALELATRLGDEFPEDLTVKARLGSVERIMGLVLKGSARPEEALQHFRQAALNLETVLSGGSGIDLYELALIHRDLAQLRANDGNRLDEAEVSRRRDVELLEKLSVESPDRFRRELADCYHELHLVLAARGNLQDADRAFNQCVEVCQQLVADHPANWSYLIQLGEQLRTVGRFQQAKEIYGKAIELKPDAWEAWSGRGLVYFHQEQWKDAIADFSRASELAPEIHANWWYRGKAYLNLSQWDNAEADFRKIIEQRLDGREVWYLRAIAFAQSNQPDKSLADLRRAIARGFYDKERVTAEPRLETLRTREDFRTLLQENWDEQRAASENLSDALRLEVHGTAQAELVVEKSSVRVTVTSVDGTDWHVQLIQLFDDLAEGAWYTARFRARADQPPPVVLIGQIHGPNWTGIGLRETVPLTEEWNSFEYVFQAKDVATINRMTFLLGQQAGSVSIADLTLTRRN